MALKAVGRGPSMCDKMGSMGSTSAKIRRAKIGEGNTQLVVKGVPFNTFAGEVEGGFARLLFLTLYVTT